jgi:hypothetical protein
MALWMILELNRIVDEGDGDFYDEIRRTCREWQVV